MDGSTEVYRTAYSDNFFLLFDFDFFLSSGELSSDDDTFLSFFLFSNFFPLELAAMAGFFPFTTSFLSIQLVKSAKE